MHTDSTLRNVGDLAPSGASGLGRLLGKGGCYEGSDTAATQVASRGRQVAHEVDRGSAVVRNLTATGAQLSGKSSRVRWCAVDGRRNGALTLGSMRIPVMAAG